MSILIEGKNLNKIYRSKDKETMALCDVSFFLNEGEVLGVVGESGSGKSTLLKVISGLEKPDSGEILHEGKDYRGDCP